MNKYIYVIIAILLMIYFGVEMRMHSFYQNINVIKKPNDILVLINKNNKLPDGFIPHNLKKISTVFAMNNKYLVAEALVNFEKLSFNAKKVGYQITAISAYRSYDYQDKLFNNYIKQKGEFYTLECSAKAGHSEHQSGLAVDVMGSNNEYELFENSKEFKWMINNCYKFGFILRYPKDKVHITGFKYEPWHYRYVGKKAAYFIYKHGICLEEYLANRY
ncbi:MAG: M15 family metallopeptidase [Bacilli bacterium]